MKYLVETVLVMAISFGCTSSSRLVSEQSSEAILLDMDFKINARLGALPVPLPDESGIKNYAVSSPGKDFEYLIVVDPIDGAGDLQLPKRESASIIESAGKFGPYIDEILQIHRLILSGEFQDSERRLAIVIDDYQQSYATFALGGLLALMQKKPLEARILFKKANRLLPNASVKKFTEIISGK